MEGWGRKVGDANGGVVVAVRTMKEYAVLYPEEEEFYRKAAVKFAWGFEKWVYGVSGEEER